VIYQQSFGSNHATLFIALPVLAALAAVLIA